MPDSQLEPFLRHAERCAVVEVLRAHPDWTLGHLFGHVEQDGPRASLLRDLTFGELLADGGLAAGSLAPDGGPPIDHARLAAANKATGKGFDEHVRKTLAEANGEAVASAYLRVRVGGPRWKLQGSLGRLVDAGVVERSGTTSATRYRVLTLDEAER